MTSKLNQVFIRKGKKREKKQKTSKKEEREGTKATIIKKTKVILQPSTRGAARGEDSG